MDIVDIVVDLCVAAVGGLIVSYFVAAGNYSGLSAAIAGIFTFLVLAIAVLAALMKLGGKRK
jgi:crotonobetainyl-CoA:carnitine CoA-transferase CaiB-like acyl-CoA transferase